VSIHLVPLAEIDRVWPILAGGMKEAVRRGGDDLTVPYLFQQCRSGAALLFVAVADEEVKAGLVCRPEQWGSKRVLRILALCGWDVSDWLPTLRSYRTWPNALDVEAVVFEGRAGWKRVIPEARVLRSVYEVELSQ
jgi:hypothetical protein